MFLNRHHKYNSGSTLLEVLLSFAIIAILSSFIVPIYQVLQIRNNLDIATNTVVQSLRRAQVLSQSVSGDANWGVYIQNGGITLFQGASFITRNSGFDEVFDLPPTLTPSGTLEFVYDKLTGDSQVSGMITLTSNTNEVRNITINEKGTISY